MTKLLKNDRASFTIETILYIQIVFFVLAFFISSYIFYTKRVFDIYEDTNQERQNMSSNAEVIRKIDSTLFTVKGLIK